MKNFLVFAFDDYHPQGGWDDLHADFSDYSVAAQWAKKEAAKGCYIYQVVNLSEGKVVYEVRQVFESPGISYLKEKTL